MSLLRAFRRCKAYDFQHTSEFGFTTLRCFDIPSRTNHVEPFALGGEDGEAEGARFYRVSSSQENMEEEEEGEGIGFSRGHHSAPSFPRRTRLPGPTSGKTSRTVRKSKLPYQNFGRSLSGSNTPTPIIIPRCNNKSKGKEETAEHPYSSSPPMELELPIVAAATATTTGAPMRSRSGSFAEIAAASGALERGTSMAAEDVFGKLIVGSPTSSSPLHNLLATGQKRSVPTFRQTGRDWSKEFQDLLKRPLLERGTELQKLSDEFVATAKSIGEVIIMERNQPYHLKTFKPLQGKGVAGGEKFKVDNIFFKFAIDHNNIYPSDRFAMKVAGHELKGLTAMVSCGMMLGLHFPLLALIDYRGFRLIATSALPISEDTIVYGSCDGGQTVHSDMFEMNTKMEKIAKILNLKGHITGLGDIQKWIYGPCDIEGHRPNDGMLYVVDTARLWPPQTPDRSVKGSFLFNLLRGEYVSKHPVPLSSDAFTMFGEHDAEIHNREVIQATEQLLNVVIPEFAAWLQSHYCHSTAFPLSPSRLIEDLHRTGINIRHLGRVRSHVMDEELRRLILGEMISRFLKNDLKARMRQIQSSEEIPYRRLVINFFNVCFGHKGTESAAFWSRYAPKELLLQFEFALSPQEQKSDFKIYEHIHLPQIFERTSELTGVKFRSSTCPLLSELTDRDLVIIDVKEKHMYAIPRIEADTLAQLALIKPMEEAQQLYSASLAKYHSVLHLKADDHLVLQNMGTVLAKMAKLAYHADSEGPAKGCSLFLAAYDKFDCSLRINPNDAKALTRWGTALCEHASSELATLPSSSTETPADITPCQQQQTLEHITTLFAKAHEKYQQASCLQPNDRDIMYNWGNQMRYQANVMLRQKKVEQAVALLGSSMQNYQACVQSSPTGKPDALTLDSLINWGCASIDMAKIKRKEEAPTAEGWFKQAKTQFLRAAALVKRGGMMQSDPSLSKDYMQIITYNLQCLTALSGDLPARDRCVQLLKQTLPAQSSFGPSLSYMQQDSDLY